MTTISISKNTKHDIELIGAMTDTYESVIQKLIEEHYKYIGLSTNLIETIINQEGRITKTLAGKTILYKIKETETTTALTP